MTLFTGCEESDHGIPGFTAPLPCTPQHTVLEAVSGFDTRWLRCPPVWVEAAAAGRTVSLASTAFAPDPLQRLPYPWPYPTPSYRYVMDGYNHEIARPQLVQLLLDTTPVRLAGREYEVRREGQGHTLYDQAGYGVPLVPCRQPDDLVPVWLDRTAGIGVYLAWLTDCSAAWAEDADWLWCSAVTQLVTHPPHAWPQALGPFLGGGIGWHFSRGVTGKGPRVSIATMEALTRRVARFFGDVAIHTLAHHAADLMLFYQPAVDEIVHQLLREALADWPHGAAARAVIAVHQEVDRQLGRLLEALGADDTLVISSDHGQEPMSRSLRPNVMLRQAGLLAVRGDKVDLARTRAVFHNSGWLLINTTAYCEGIVPPEEYEATLQEVERCLEAAVDPATGQTLGLRHSRHLWQGSTPPPGDLFVWGPTQTELRPYLFGPVCTPPEVGGHHQTSLHDSPYLQAILAGCGPGFAGMQLPRRNAEVAALIRRSLHLPDSGRA
jgi:hypothetical protein